MGIPLRQMTAVGRYVLRHRRRRTPRYPLVLMLEPLFRCNLSCAGCGKVQHPKEVLDRQLSVEECLAAAGECGAPVVSLAGGEPTIHPDCAAIVEGLLAQGRFVYLCTNGLLYERMLPKLKPSPRLSFNIHLDGSEEIHDGIARREGVCRTAIEADRAAKAAGFRVTTNTTLFDGAAAGVYRELFDLLASLRVDGMTLAPGYSYEKADGQDRFLARARVHELARELLEKRPRAWAFNHSPQYLEFLQGKREYQCTPWGTPTRNVFGWQRPCYLLADSHAASFAELLEKTDWERYGRGRDPRCEHCMTHCGYEPSAVIEATSSVRGMLSAALSLLWS